MPRNSSCRLRFYAVSPRNHSPGPPPTSSLKLQSSTKPALHQLAASDPLSAHPPHHSRALVRCCASLLVRDVGWSLPIRCGPLPSAPSLRGLQSGCFHQLGPPVQYCRSKQHLTKNGRSSRCNSVLLQHCCSFPQDTFRIAMADGSGGGRSTPWVGSLPSSFIARGFVNS